MRNLISLIAIATLSFAAQIGAAPAGYNLVWSDEFNAADNSAPNGATWGYDTGCSGFGNAEWENYTNSTANSYVASDGAASDGKTLIIKAISTGGGNCGYTSARLLTSGKRSFQYGYIETRIKMPYGQGIWPAFWMLGTNIGSVGWPACGEIDIMENIGKAGEQGKAYGTLHGPGYSGGGGLAASYTLPGGALFKDAYHTFAIRWENNIIEHYVDGVLYATRTPASLPGGSAWVFNAPFFLIMNLAVGGGWPGYPDGSTVFPQEYRIDYVRLYQQGGPTLTPTLTPTPWVSNTWRVNAGGPSFTDGAGNAWLADTQFTGGTAAAVASAIAGTNDDTLYQSERYGASTYTFNVPAGSYRVTLKFAETYWTAAGQRVFNVAINGANVLSNFDIVALSGGQNIALDRVFSNVAPQGGQITISFSTGTADLPKIAAIEIIPQPASPTPTRSFTRTATPTTQPTTLATATRTATSIVTPVVTGTQTLIPLNSGMQMTAQFVNNTCGQHADSDIWIMAIVRNAAGQFCWVQPNGNLIPCVSGENTLGYFYSLSSLASGMQWPSTMTSGRLYVAYGGPLNMAINTAGDGSVGVAFPNTENPSDPSVNRDFDWIEFAVLNNAIWCNTTQVDLFDIPLKLELYQGNASSYSLYGQAGIVASSDEIRAAWAAEVPAEFQSLMNSQRIMAPIHSPLATNGYWDAYVNQVWNQYKTQDLVIPTASGTFTGRVGGDNRLAFTRPGDAATYYVSKPTTFDVWGGAGALATGNWAELMLEAQICAGFHRHVIHDAANLNNPAAYYQAGPADYYAKFWHDHSLDARAYGFCYDDVNDQSSTLSCASPRGIVLSIGGRGCATTTTPSRTATKLPTQTATPTRSFTSLPTQTFSATQTRVPSASSTATSSPSALPTATRSFTALPTQTPSNVASSTALATASATAQASHTRTALATPTASAQATASATTQATSTATALSSASPTSQATASATLQASASPTAQATGSPTSQASATRSGTPSVTRSPTSMPSATSSPTRSATPSASSTPQSSPSATATSSPTSLATFSASPSPTMSATASLSSSPAATASGTATFTSLPTQAIDTDARITEAMGYPSRAPSALLFKSTGPLSEVTLRIYSSALILVAELKSGPWPAGWSSMPLGSLGSLHGTYFFKIYPSASKDPKAGRSGVLWFGPK